MTADDEPLQMQLRGDAHVHINVQRVVMRDKRARRRAAGDGVEDGSLDLDIAPARPDNRRTKLTNFDRISNVRRTSGLTMRST